LKTTPAPSTISPIRNTRANNGTKEPVAEVGDQFALAPPGCAGLQAQKWVATENTSASPIVIGTTLAIVPPSISTTSER